MGMNVKVLWYVCSGSLALDNFNGRIRKSVVGGFEEFSNT